jgi:hypothetical protein
MHYSNIKIISEIREILLAQSQAIFQLLHRFHTKNPKLI